MTNHSFDAFFPAEMARKAEASGVAKAHLGRQNMLSLAVLAGAFIAFGAIFATTAISGSTLSFGLTKVVAGFVFSLGLILVIVAGAELFTGNNLIVMAWASGKVSTWQMLHNWLIVYVGNFIGAFSIAVLTFMSGQYLFGGGVIGKTALAIANSKLQLGFVQAIVLGILCNILVCLAVWLCMSARTTTDKVMAIVFPITAFVAAGFEHSIANMYFVPIGLLIKRWGSAEFLNSLPSTYPDLTWSNFFLRNLLPVTIGNIIGGAVLVGLAYWSIYLYKLPAHTNSK